MRALSRRVWGIAWLGVLAGAALPGCNFKQDTSAAEREVEAFHRDLDAGNFKGLYSAAHADLKASSTEANFVTLLEAVHRKLGAVTSTKQQGWNVNTRNLTTDVRLVYETQFASGPGTEQFVYRITGGKALLLSYNINSMTLITK